MEQFVAERTVGVGMGAPTVVAELVRANPDRFGAEAAFAVTAVAAALEHPVVEGGETFTAMQQALFRAAAILAADIYAVEMRLGMRCTCGDIHQFWEQTGEVFFTPAKT